MDIRESDAKFEETMSVVELLDRCIKSMAEEVVTKEKRTKAELLRENFLLKNMFLSAKEFITSLSLDNPLPINDQQFTIYCHYQRYIEKYYKELFEESK